MNNHYFRAIFVSLLSSIFLSTSSLLVHAQELEGGCRMASTSTSSPLHPSNDLSKLGGLDNIDKIVRVDVAWGIWTCIFGLGAQVVTELVVHTRLRDGNVVTSKFGNDGGCNRGRHTVTFEEDEYLTGLDMFQGDLVDYVTFYTSSGERYGPYGGGGPNPPRSTPVYGMDRSVIKAFHWQAGEAVDRLGVYYETNGLLARIIDSPLSLISASDVGEDDSQGGDGIVIPANTSPEQVQSFDNTDGLTPVTRTFRFEDTFEAQESTTLSSSSTLDIGLTVSAGVSVGVFSAGVEFSVGYSFTNGIEERNTVTETKTVGTEDTFTVLPGTKVDAIFSYNEIEYSFEFSGPVNCVYSFAPNTSELGGEVDGTIQGVNALQETTSIRIVTTGGDEDGGEDSDKDNGNGGTTTETETLAGDPDAAFAICGNSKWLVVFMFFAGVVPSLLF